jgi:hypothetical protein
LLSLPAGTEMFHFPALPPPALCVQAGVTGNYARQVSLFGNPRINVWLPTSRGLSQAPTSFFGSWCQGIHRVPLLTWRLQLMLASTVQFSRYGRSRSAHLRIRGGAVPVRETSFRPFPQDPTACPASPSPPPPFRPGGRTSWVERRAGRITSAPQMSSHPEHSSGHGSRREPRRAAPGAP